MAGLLPELEFYLFRNNDDFLMKPMLKRFSAVFALTGAVATLLLVAAGCANYELGAGTRLPFESIYVAPVVNRSMAPQAQAVLTDQVVDRLRRDARVRVTDAAGAQAQLTVTLVDYRRFMGASQAADTQLARSFEEELVAEITLVDKRTGTTYLNKQQVSARQQVFSGGSLSQAEYNAMPELTGKLALAIANAVQGAW